MTKYIPVVKNNNESLKYLMDKLHMGLNMALQPFDIKQVTNVGFHIEVIGEDHRIHKKVVVVSVNNIDYEKE